MTAFASEHQNPAGFRGPVGFCIFYRCCALMPRAMLPARSLIRTAWAQPARVPSAPIEQTQYSGMQ
jgi:hypothetical protein